MKDNKFNDAVEIFQQLKGITKKTSERLIVDLIENPQKIVQMIEGLNFIQANLGECPICFYLTVDGKCLICDDLTRNSSQILVVSSILDAKTVEDTNTYHGLYAITKGEINLAKGMGPEKLEIDAIFQRIKTPETELILAFNATFNGEVTANYIRELAKKKKVKFSKIARGIPIGGVLDYMDEITLTSSIKNRSDKE